MEGLNKNYLLKELEETTKEVEILKKILSSESLFPDSKLTKLKESLKLFTEVTNDLLDYHFNKLKKEGKIKLLSHNDIDELINDVKNKTL
jgi:hypothetical protein